MYVVGFTETMYNISENDSQVEVCVALISPEGDIYGGNILVEVFSEGADISTIPANHTPASMLACMAPYFEVM